MMVSREGTGTLKTCAEVVWEMALKGTAVTFCPPLKTPNFTWGVTQPMRSSLIRTFSKVSLMISGIYTVAGEKNI
jgi:hypothetical protein